MPQPLLTSKERLSGSREWRHHRAHALLGFFVLSHFLFRYAIFFFANQETHPDMGFDSSTKLFQLLIPHLLLQLSGFGFSVPSKRHPNGNRIWGEYRWHALIFFARCVVLMSLAWFRKQHNDKEALSFSRLPAIATVFITMMCADAATAWFQAQGASSTTTIRGLKGPPALSYLMSVAQFHATVNCLLTSTQMSVQLAALVVVQSSAFGMTLCRKGLLGHAEGLVLYSFVLILGMWVIGRDLAHDNIVSAATATGNLAALARIDLQVNKYIVWAMVVSLALPAMDHNHKNDIVWSHLSKVSTFLLFWSAARRQITPKCPSRG